MKFLNIFDICEVGLSRSLFEDTLGNDYRLSALYPVSLSVDLYVKVRYFCQLITSPIKTNKRFTILPDRHRRGTT